MSPCCSTGSNLRSRADRARRAPWTSSTSLSARATEDGIAARAILTIIACVEVHFENIPEPRLALNNAAPSWARSRECALNSNTYAYILSSYVRLRPNARVSRDATLTRTNAKPLAVVGSTRSMRPCISHSTHTRRTRHRYSDLS